MDRRAAEVHEQHPLGYPRADDPAAIIFTSGSTGPPTWATKRRSGPEKPCKRPCPRKSSRDNGYYFFEGGQGENVALRSPEVLPEKLWVFG